MKASAMNPYKGLHSPLALHSSLSHPTTAGSPFEDHPNPLVSDWLVLLIPELIIPIFLLKF
jgi:hypothetical protein